MLGIYTRVSTEDQANKGISLENQELRGKELAAKLGLNFQVYCDAGLSGSIPFNKRPQLNSLIDDIYSKKITSVFVFDLSRLSRGDIIQITGLKNIFKENSVRLFELNGEIDLNDINVELLTDLRQLINAFYLKQTSANIKSNLEKNVRDGKVTGGPLLNYGYTKDNDKKLIINEVEAETVREIYQLALEGKGTKIIASHLNNKGIPTKRGNVTTGKTMKVRGKTKAEFVWRDSVVYRILTGTIYKGIRLYKGKQYAAPAIIDEITFDLVQVLLKNRDQFKTTTNKYNFLLKGLIECPICGGKFYGHKRLSGKDNAYTCNSNRYGKNCGNRGISIDYLDDLVIQSIYGLDNLIDHAFDTKMSSMRERALLNSLNKVRTKTSETQSRLNNLIGMAETAKIEPATFKNRLEELQNEINGLKSDEARTEKDLNLIKDRDSLIQVAREGIVSFKKMKLFEQKVNFIRNVIKRITVQSYESNRYGILIYFHLNQLDSYLISRELNIDRNGRKDGKAKTKLISEKIDFDNTLVVDTSRNKIVQDFGPYLTYDNSPKSTTLKNTKKKS